METAIQNKVDSYCIEFRNLFFKEIDTILGDEINSTDHIKKKINEFKMKSTFIPFPRVNKSDFKRKKRLKNIVPENEQCMALCSGGIRCSRRKQSGSLYCGTHLKGQPNGAIHTTLDNKLDEQSERYIYPYDDNGIIKLYLNKEKTELMNANEYLKEINIK